MYVCQRHSFSHGLCEVKVYGEGSNSEAPLVLNDDLIRLYNKYYELTGGKYEKIKKKLQQFAFDLQNVTEI